MEDVLADWAVGGTRKPQQDLAGWISFGGDLSNRRSTLRTRITAGQRVLTTATETLFQATPIHEAVKPEQRTPPEPIKTCADRKPDQGVYREAGPVDMPRQPPAHVVPVRYTIKELVVSKSAVVYSALSRGSSDNNSRPGPTDRHEGKATHGSGVSTPKAFRCFPDRHPSWERSVNRSGRRHDMVRRPHNLFCRFRIVVHPERRTRDRECEAHEGERVIGLPLQPIPLWVVLVLVPVVGTNNLPDWWPETTPNIDGCSLEVCGASGEQGRPYSEADVRHERKHRTPDQEACGFPWRE